MDNSTGFTLFGPLSKKYCVFFYYLSIYWFVLFVLLIVSGLFFGISKKMGGLYYLNVILLSVGYGLLYFMARLFHSMCVGSM